MDQKLKERLLGAVIILSVLVFVLPMLFKHDNEIVISSAQDLDPSEEVLDNKLDFDENLRVPLKVSTKPLPVISTISKESKLTRVWVLRMGIFNHPNNAKSLVERLVAKGYHAYSSVDTRKGISMTRVFVGPYKNEYEIKKIRDRLKNELNIQGLALFIEAPEVGATT